MSTPIPAVIASRLEKAAVDNGFDQELPRPAREGGTLEWLAFASTQCPLRIWFGMLGDGGFVAAFSEENVAEKLPEFGTVFDGSFPLEQSAHDVSQTFPPFTTWYAARFSSRRHFPTSCCTSLRRRLQHSRELHRRSG